jgi:hypothetical protein
MLLVHLPDGPTARFRLSSLVLGKDIKVGGKGGKRTHGCWQRGCLAVHHPAAQQECICWQIRWVFLSSSLTRKSPLTKAMA